MMPPGPAAAGGPVATTVVRLCDEAAALLGPPAHPAVAALRAAMVEPLRVAVVGRVSTGKSTLVNALIGRRIAPTAAGECTRVATWYRFGAPDRAQLVLRDGTVHPLPFDGALPETLAVDPERVDRIEVWLQSGLLRQLTLVDTPGLGSLDRPGDTATRAVAAAEDASARAATHASALLFLFRDVEKHDDMALVRDHHAAAGAAGVPAAGVIGVLSQADLFGAGPWAADDPLESAATVAARIAGEHASLLAAVAPVAPLLAAAARTGVVTEQDARVLAALVPTETARLQLFPRVGAPEGVRPEDLQRLLAEFGPYAVHRARPVAAAGAAAVRDWLERRSGIRVVEELVSRRFVRRTVPLTADRVLRDLRRLARADAHRAPGAARLANRIEQAELEPQMHRITELRALHSLTGRRGAAAAELRAQLALLIDHDEPWRQVGASGPLSGPAQRAALQELQDRAHAATVMARDPLVGAAARVLNRSYALRAASA